MSKYIHKSHCYYSSHLYFNKYNECNTDLSPVALQTDYCTAFTRQRFGADLLKFTRQRFGADLLKFTRQRFGADLLTISSYNFSNDTVSKVMLCFIIMSVHGCIPAVHPFMIQGFEMHFNRFSNSIYTTI